MTDNSRKVKPVQFQTHKQKGCPSCYKVSNNHLYRGSSFPFFKVTENPTIIEDGKIIEKI